MERATKRMGGGKPKGPNLPLTKKTDKKCAGECHAKSLCLEKKKKRERGRANEPKSLLATQSVSGARRGPCLERNSLGGGKSSADGPRPGNKRQKKKRSVITRSRSCDRARNLSEKGKVRGERAPLAAGAQVKKKNSKDPEVQKHDRSQEKRRT